MRYELDYKKYDDLTVFYSHIYDMYEVYGISDEETRERFVKAIPRETLVNVSYLLDTEVNITENTKLSMVYLGIAKVISELHTLSIFDIKSNEFPRDIENLKKKADYIASLSHEPITIRIPKTLSDIKSLFYHYCFNHARLKKEVISKLFKSVFGSKACREYIEIYEKKSKVELGGLRKFMYMLEDNEEFTNDYVLLNEEYLKREGRFHECDVEYYTASPEFKIYN